LLARHWHGDKIAMTEKSEVTDRDVGHEAPLPSSLTIHQAQKLVDDWIKDLGVRYFSELTNLAQLVDGEQSFKESDRKSSLEDELADVFFVLICIANQTGVDLTSALSKNLEKKTNRDLDRHKNNPKLQ